MGALKKSGGRVNGGIGQGHCGHGERVNGGIENGQWGHWSGSMVVLKRVNGGSENGQWGHWSGLMVVLKGSMGRWSGSMGALRRVRSDRGLAVSQTGVWLWVRQEVVLQGCKLYLTGL